MALIKKILLWTIGILLGIVFVFAIYIVWLFSIIERNDPIVGFILSSNAYTFREVPENIMPLGTSRDEFLKNKSVRKFEPIEDHNTKDSREGFHRILRNRLGQCDMDLRLYATFDTNSKLTSLNGFTPTYMCTIEP